MSPRTHHPRSHKEKPVTESETETILEPGDPGYVDPRGRFIYGQVTYTFPAFNR